MYSLKDNLIRIDNVSLSFGTTHVLSNVSAEVRDVVRPNCVTGQVVGILGPSGVGKSQLSRILAGLQEPTSGAVTVGPSSTAIKAGVVGYVMQHYPLLRHRTILSNLTLSAQNAGKSPKEAEEEAMGHLKRFQLEDRWDAYPIELSGGQRQRVAIAQQLMCSEHYLILDEPTTGLDPIMKDKVCDLIRQVAALSEENTIFVVSHDIPAVCAVADYLWILGRNFDEQRNPLGANVKYTMNLMDRGIAWHPNLAINSDSVPGFRDLVSEVRSCFASL